MIGRLRAETLEALQDWTNSARAGQITAAPLSALLRAAP
jgi:polysaccharide deacetylase 2 family uncharacterized protein YibQ